MRTSEAQSNRVGSKASLYHQKEEKAKKKSHLPNDLGTFSQTSLASVVHHAITNFKSAIKKNAKVSPEKEILPDTNSERKIVESICDALRKFGEEPHEVLPLLNNVMLPDIDFADTLFEMRPEAHTSLLASLLCRMVNKLTEHRPMAIIIDDVQW
jgi:enolase